MRETAPRRPMARPPTTRASCARSRCSARVGRPALRCRSSPRLHSKATLLRLIESLETRGYVIHMPDSRGHDRGIALGPRAAQFALAALSNNTFTRGCRSVLRSLVDVLGETCNLTALDGDTVLYVERVETIEPLRLEMRPGMRVPLHCTASGKLFLSQLNALERNAMLARLTLKKMTYRTLTDAQLLAAEPTGSPRASGSTTRNSCAGWWRLRCP